MHPQDQTHISGALPFIRKLSKQDAALLGRHAFITALCSGDSRGYGVVLAGARVRVLAGVPVLVLPRVRE